MQMAMLPSLSCGIFKHPILIPAPSYMCVEPLMEPSIHEVRLNPFMENKRTQRGTERRPIREMLHSSLLCPMSVACWTQWSTSPILAPAPPSGLPSSQASPRTNRVGSSLCAIETSADAVGHCSHTETEAAVESVSVKRGREWATELSFSMRVWNEPVKSQKRTRTKCPRPSEEVMGFPGRSFRGT